jgi:hypothetical protein
LANKAFLKLRAIRTDPHERDVSCIAHREDVCLSCADLAAKASKSNPRH